MTNDILEDPTLGKPEEGAVPVETPPEVPAAGDEVSELMAELEKAGVTNSDDLRGKLDASKQAGQLANLLGETREEVRKLKEASTAKPREPQNDWDVGLESQGTTVDLEATLGKVLDKREAKQREEATKVQQAWMGAWNAIQNDEDYNLIKDVWEDKLKDPNFVSQIQTGQVNPLQEYQKTLRGYYKDVIKKSYETFQNLKGAGQINPPHIEQGGRTPANLVAGTEKESPKEARIKELRLKSKKGFLSNEEELELATIAFS